MSKNAKPDAFRRYESIRRHSVASEESSWRKALQDQNKRRTKFDEEERRRAEEIERVLNEEHERLLDQLHYDDIAGEKPWIDDPSVPDSVKQPDAVFDEYGVHDTFYDYANKYERLRKSVSEDLTNLYDGAKDYERTRLTAAKAMRQLAPGRQSYMERAVALIHERSHAPTIQDFIAEVCARLGQAKVPVARAERNQKLAISRAEVEIYVQDYFWKQFATAQTEIGRLRDQLTEALEREAVLKDIIETEKRERARRQKERLRKQRSRLIAKKTRTTRQQK
jgi:hypothetical protein